MSIEYILDRTCPSDWDTSLTKEGGFLQSSFWANAIESLEDGYGLFITASKSGQPIARLLATVSVSPQRGVKGRFRQFVLMLAGFGRGTVSVNEGPIFLTPEFADVVAVGMLECLDRVAREARCRRIRVLNPYEFKLDAEKQVALVNVFHSFEYISKNWGTYLVDLRKNEAELFAMVEQSVRKAVKKCQREGVLIKQIETWDEYLHFFLKSYVTWKGDENYELLYHRAAVLWGLPEHGCFYSYFVALTKNEEPLAVLGMYARNGIATEITSGLGPLAIKQKLPAQDFLHWEMFLAAKRLGCHTFDLAGVAPEPSDIKQASIRNFKKKFNGTYLEYPVYEKDSRPKWLIASILWLRSRVVK